MQKEFILMNKKVFGSDINIQDFYIMKYLDNFPKKFNPITRKEDWDDVPPIRNIHISYMDYEWDIAVSDKKEEQPIYMGTYIDGFHNVCYTYYLDRPEYSRCAELSTRRDEIVAEMLKIVDEDIEKLHITDLNKKELKIALLSSISATASEKYTGPDFRQIYRVGQAVAILGPNGNYRTRKGSIAEIVSNNLMYVWMEDTYKDVNNQWQVDFVTDKDHIIKL
jgi:hypothetical protein